VEKRESDRVNTMQTIAAIDVGSNALRLLIGKVDDALHMEPLESLRVPVRLGKDTFHNGIGTISEANIQETVNAFSTFQKVMHDYGVSHFRAVSTSAMREAANREILVDRILQATGIPVEVISGEEEARLIHLAVSKALDLQKYVALLVDIGGGSMEATLSLNGNIVFAESYKIGTVRLLSQLNQPDNPGISFEELIHEFIESPRRRLHKILEDQPVNLLVSTGGNVETLGELARKLFLRKNNQSLSLKDLDLLIERLESTSFEDRINQLGLRPDRADVILPAAILLKAVVDETHLPEVSIPHVSLKEGVLWDMAEETTPGTRLSRREQVWVSIQRLGSKYEMDEGHARHVVELAGSIFDQTRQLHALAPDYRLLLEAAAYLHDIGHFISTIDHDKHGYYILTANPLIGLTDEQQAMLATMVRFHRRQPPTLEDPAFRLLQQKDRLVVMKLLSILRIADGLDTNRSGRVKQVSLKNERSAWELDLSGEGDLLLEKWTADKRKNLFCELFGVTLEIKD
jgi:exopolyphosphatase / guanosine-5'-triphosphate,3'-diphosphate pyrophosphatase